MRKSAPIEVVVHYPKTEEGWEELGKRVATCLLYTSDAADEEDSVDLGGRGSIKKKKKR